MRMRSLLILPFTCLVFLSSCACPPPPPQPLFICSFNITNLGLFKVIDRDDTGLAELLQDFDIVVIQELVAPPVDVTYPDDDTDPANPEAKEFFDAMASKGFSYWLSEEDTGTGDNIHNAGSATEWWVAFYRPGVVQKALDLPHGFLEEDRSNHDYYERVPYAFPFRTTDKETDFVLISVHLDPDSSYRRAEEITAIASWVDAKDETEKDFIILGDMNFQNCTELANALPPGYVSLNSACAATNTAADGKPYDHVLYQPAFSTEVTGWFVIVDLVAVMEDYWTSEEPYPGDPYDHNAFRMVYSDHRPIVFSLTSGVADDD